MFAKRTLAMAAGAIALSLSSASADQMSELMRLEATPFLHHSCETLIEESNGSEEYVLSVVGKMVAVSLYNRGIDINEYASNDEEKAALRETFLVELKAGCSADQASLLAGVIDQAVKKTLGL